MRSALIALLAALAVAAPASAGRAAATKTIRVISDSISVTSHDVKPKGPSKGDTVVYHDRLSNADAQFGKAKGAKVGTDQAVVTLVSPAVVTIVGKAVLPGGTLILSGHVNPLPNGGLSVPVTGGTGAFAHMHGTLTVAPGKDHVLNTYLLTTGAGLVA
jgi:hypothetical protein